MHKPDVLFVLSIDTEEEWLWDDDFPQDNCSVSNIELLPAFQDRCVQSGVRPTYFVDYAVAQNQTSSGILKDFHRNKSAEIGAHLHPWCNPPYFGKTTEAESHVINLPIQQVEKKLDTLTEMLIKNVGAVPRSFRSGRWGINAQTLKLLTSRGYKVDSSVYPYYNNQYFSCQGAPSYPYWPSHESALRPGDQRNIMEIPVTAGFNRRDFNAGNQIHNLFAHPALSWTKSVGFLWHSRLLKKLYLSPELTATEDMNTLMKMAIENRHPVIHMYLHSSSLIDGVTGFIKTDNAFEFICNRMESSISYLKDIANVRFCTISEAAILLEQRSQSDVIRRERAL